MYKGTVAACLLFIATITSAHAAVASLCESKEITVWSCRTKAKIYSVCASKDLSGTTGYMQYRAGTDQKTEFRFPSSLQHPKHHFELGSMARGVQLSFNNGQYSYMIAEHLSDGAIIYVQKAGKIIASIDCLEATGTLMDTPAIYFLMPDALSD